LIKRENNLPENSVAFYFGKTFLKQTSALINAGTEVFVILTPAF